MDSTMEVADRYDGTAEYYSDHPHVHGGGGGDADDVYSDSPYEAPQAVITTLEMEDVVRANNPRCPVRVYMCHRYSDAGRPVRLISRTYGPVAGFVSLEPSMRTCLAVTEGADLMALSDIQAWYTCFEDGVVVPPTVRDITAFNRLWERALYLAARTVCDRNGNDMPLSHASFVAITERMTVTVDQLDCFRTYTNTMESSDATRFATSLRHIRAAQPQERTTAVPCALCHRYQPPHYVARVSGSDTRTVCLGSCCGRAVTDALNALDYFQKQCGVWRPINPLLRTQAPDPEEDMPPRPVYGGTSGCTAATATGRYCAGGGGNEGAVGYGGREYTLTTAGYPH